MARRVRRRCDPVTDSTSQLLFHREEVVPQEPGDLHEALAHGRVHAPFGRASQAAHATGNTGSELLDRAISQTFQINLKTLALLRRLGRSTALEHDAQRECASSGFAGGLAEQEG